ncbi:MFS transporter [Paraburkholderia nemoris]|uniref:MFS transporter n=1 Tax=Paraburkholderia nemoris TaxID=2793076 RepID=UPI0038B88906
MTTEIDINNEIAGASIGTFHWKIGLIIAAIMFFDGYDLFNAAYIIPFVMKTWRPSASEIGMMLSSGIVGMSIGSLVQGFAADRIGRRRVMVCGLYLLAVSNLLLATVVHTSLQFAIFRLVLGMCLGMNAPLAIAYVNEWAPRKSANVYAIWVLLVGFSIGGIAAGAAGIYLTGTYGWQALYYLGTAVILVAVFAHLALPESIAFLVLRRRDHEVASLLCRLRAERIAVYRDATFVTKESGNRTASPLSVLRRPYRRNTLVVWVVGAASLFCIHGLTGWLPSVMVARGEAMSSAFAYSALVMLASLFGSLSSGVLADRIGSRIKAMGILYLLASASMVGLALVSGRGVTFVLVIAAGFFVFGAQAVLNNFIAMVYHTGVRATGVGVAIAVGRVGGILGPFVIGLVKSIDPDPMYTFFLLAIALLIAGATLVLARHEITSGHVEEEQVTSLKTRSA